jgi:hypothetical protein
MELLGSLFIGKPLNILGFAAIFLVICIARPRAIADKQHKFRWPMVATFTWVAYAVWEWLILVRTPEANIRIDLLVIWPIVAVFSAWTIFRVFR